MEDHMEYAEETAIQGVRSSSPFKNHHRAQNALKTLTQRFGFSETSSVRSCPGKPVKNVNSESGDMGGCQNYGPFLDPHYNTAPNI